MTRQRPDESSHRTQSVPGKKKWLSARLLHLHLHLHVARAVSIAAPVDGSRRRSTLRARRVFFYFCKMKSPELMPCLGLFALGFLPGGLEGGKACRHRLCIATGPRAHQVKKTSRREKIYFQSNIPFLVIIMHLAELIVGSIAVREAGKAFGHSREISKGTNARFVGDEVVGQGGSGAQGLTDLGGREGERIAQPYGVTNCRKN